MQYQKVISKIINITEKNIDIESFINLSFAELLSLPDNFAKNDTSFKLIIDNGNLKVDNNTGNFPKKCRINKHGKCFCAKVAKLTQITECKNDTTELLGLHYCIPIFNEKKIQVILILHSINQLDNLKSEFIKTIKNLAETYISTKNREKKLILKAQQQNVLNQKLFSQSLEIDQKNIEIEEQKLKIKEQYEDLQTSEEELRQNNEELQTLIENIEQQKEIIKESKEKYEILFEDSYDATLILSENKIIDCNTATLKIFGYKKKHELLLLRPEDLSPPEQPDKEKSSKKVDKMIAFALENRVHKFEWLHKRKNNQIFPTEILLTAIPYNNKTVIHAVIRDLTELKDKERKIKEQHCKIIQSEKKYKAVLTNLDDIFYRTNVNQELVLISPSALKYTNIKSISELIGRNVPEMFYYNPEDRIKILEALKYNNGNITNYEILLKNRKNEPVTFETNSHFIFDNAGNIAGVEGVLRDITERKTAEIQLKMQKQEIETAHKNITDSINYAKTIQNALLTKKELIDSYLNNYFLLFKPKEQVSGDFYYINKIDKHIIFAVADCTGHGVPGAFLTMLAITYLHEIVKKEETENTGKALDILRERFKETFKTFGTNNRNGLDIALCAINTETNILQYAGAYNPLIIIRDNKLTEYKATRNPIGFYPKEKPFRNNEIQLQNNDRIYIFSDGFQDQFGEIDNKKFMSKKFRQLLLDIHKLPMKTQENKLNKVFMKWKGYNDQTDDILIFGMKFNE